MMAKATVLASLLAAPAAFAAPSNTVSVLAGMDKGGFAMGANLDIADTETESYGGYARLFSKDKDEGAPALFAFGAHFRGQLKHGIFRYYLAPGFGLIHHNFDDTRILVGPSLSYGVNAELDIYSSVGIENTKLYSWGGKYKGIMADAFFAQYTFSFN